MFRIRVGRGVEYPLECLWIGEQELILLKSNKTDGSDTSTTPVSDGTCSKDSLEANDVSIEALPFKVGQTDRTLEQLEQVSWARSTTLEADTEKELAKEERGWLGSRDLGQSRAGITLEQGINESEGNQPCCHGSGEHGERVSECEKG